MVALLVREENKTTFQWCVMVPLIFHHLAIGFVLSYPAILTPAITRNTSDGTEVHASKDEASWIAAAYSMTGGIGFLILPPLMQIYGRRFINVTMNLIILSGWIIIALSPNVPLLITGRAIQGLSFGGLYICSILAGEYSHPKRRGFFIIFKITATSVGELICHGYGFTVSWRLMAWLASIPPALAALGTIVWPESPSWLAYKGRYDECVSSFELIRGKGTESKREVQELISAQQELKNIKKSTTSGVLLRNLQAMKTREFRKPFTVVLIIIILTQVCGRHYLLAYVVQIMISLTGEQSKAYYYTIGLDTLKIVAVLTSSYIVRICKRRTLLLGTGTIACMLLSLVCFFHLLVQEKIINKTWLTPILLIIYNIVCYVGVIPVSMVLKETKDRTLQNIELEFLDIKVPKGDNGFELSTGVNSNFLAVK
ncbi:facilitated trehalose transporter Tret1 [Helicoverpa armigera]|uniref:facilitated trehalose transporter Tret1 n=1 Tax=Helicoverpa armigera TaxID=29058 RepID=UPI0030827300